MASFAINHMTAANASFTELLAIVQESGCDGIELRNDLPGSPLFGHHSAREAGQLAKSSGLEIHALAEVVAFNLLTDETIRQANELALQANDCGAAGIVLIPANDGSNPDTATRKSRLSESLSALLPVLEEFDLCGFIEPLGFETSTLRYKSEVVECIEAMNLASRFKLIHDTFHHHLAGEKDCFAAHTAMVHVSGVVDKNIKPLQMQDSDRVLVNEQDQLTNIDQLRALTADGYQGPISMEAFAPEIHDLPDLAAQLRDSFNFINSGLAAAVA